MLEKDLASGPPRPRWTGLAELTGSGGQHGPRQCASRPAPAPWAGRQNARSSAELRVGCGGSGAVRVRDRRARHRQDDPGRRLPRRAGGQRPAPALARGRCSERLAGTEAYLPFLEALDSLLHGDRGEAAAQVMKIVAPTWYVQVVPLAAEIPALARVLAEARGLRRNA